MAEETIADVNASGLWPGKVVTEVTPVSDFWEAEPEHQDYLECYPNGYTCHFPRPNWVLPSGRPLASPWQLLLMLAWMLGPRTLHGLEADFFLAVETSLCGGGHGPRWCPLWRILALWRAALTVLLNRVAPEDLAALERVAETIAAALPEALAALTTCRFCDERRSIDRPMEVFGPLQNRGSSTATA